MVERKDLGKTSMGMVPNVAAGLSYVLGIITGLVFFFGEKENKFVKFHAMQSILFSCAWFVVVFLLTVTVVGLVLLPFVYLVFVVLWVLLMIKGFGGEKFKLPLIGNWAEKST